MNSLDGSGVGMPGNAIVVSPAQGRVSGLKALVTNTPLLAIDYTWRGRHRTIFAKAEHLNFTGCIKDRMAVHILRRAYERDVPPGG